MQILLPGASLLWMPVRRLLRLAYETGFDGVELLVTNWNRHLLGAYSKMASDMGLTLHFHQPWSLAENRTHLVNHVLAAVGCIPRNEYHLEDYLPHEGPCVVYADRMSEALIHPNWWIQTCSVFNSEGEHKLPFEQFHLRSAFEGRSIVLDTTHYLEYRLGIRGVEELPQDREKLFEILLGAWRLFGPRVKEIHWNDCDPRLGHTNGRNILPGSGILPLRELAEFIKAGDWDGVIVPEVRPTYFLSNVHQRVSTLLYSTQRFFV